MAENKDENRRYFRLLFDYLIVKKGIISQDNPTGMDEVRKQSGELCCFTTEGKFVNKETMMRTVATQFKAASVFIYSIYEFQSKEDFDEWGRIPHKSTLTVKK